VLRLSPDILMPSTGDTRSLSTSVAKTWHRQYSELNRKNVDKMITGTSDVALSYVRQSVAGITFGGAMTR
jgi:hypothetical protein